MMVLWFLVLLTALAAGFAFVSRTEAQLSRNYMASVQARLLAEAGIERAAYELFRPPADMRRWKPDGRPHAWQFDGMPVRVVMRDESAKLDLNKAPEVLIMGLLKHVGLSEEEAARLTDAIVDWRDADDLRLPYGAEAPDYEEAGLAQVPANAPFESVEEVRLVMGMTPALYARIRGVLTVHSRVPGFNGSTAPAKVLYSMPNVDPEAVRDYLAQRDKAWAEDLPVPVFPPAQAYLLQNQVIVNLVAEAETPSGAVFVRETSLKLAYPVLPHLVVRYTWIEGEPAERPAESPQSDGEPG